MKTQKRVLKNQPLTKADIEQVLGAGGRAVTLGRMLNNEQYSYKIKALLYSKGKVSARGFLLNNDIFNLPLGKKDPKGVILIDSDVMGILERYELSDSLAAKGDGLTAFLVDNSDTLYKVLSEFDSDKAISEEEYVQVFNLVYNEISSKLTGMFISDFISKDPKLLSAMTAIIEKKEEKEEKEDIKE